MILPAMKCRVHQMQERIFGMNQKRDLINYLFEILDYSAIVIKSLNKGIKITSSISPMIKLPEYMIHRKIIFGKRILEYDLSKDNRCL